MVEAGCLLSLAPQHNIEPPGRRGIRRHEGTARERGEDHERGVERTGLELGRRLLIAHEPVDLHGHGLGHDNRGQVAHRAGDDLDTEGDRRRVVDGQRRRLLAWSPGNRSGRVVNGALPCRTANVVVFVD